MKQSSWEWYSTHHFITCLRQCTLALFNISFALVSSFWCRCQGLLSLISILSNFNTNLVFILQFFLSFGVFCFFVGFALVYDQIEEHWIIAIKFWDRENLSKKLKGTKPVNLIEWYHDRFERRKSRHQSTMWLCNTNIHGYYFWN